MKAKRIASLVLILLVAMSSATAMAADRWLFLTMQNDGTYYFDTESIEYKIESDKTESNNINVNKEEIYYWEKQFYSTEKAKKHAKQLDDKRFSKVAYTLDYIKLTKKPKTRTVISTIYYDQDGKTIMSFSHKDDEGAMILAPDTLGEYLFDLVVEYCKVHDEEITARSKGEK